MTPRDIQILRTISNIRDAIELGNSANIAADVAKLVVNGYFCSGCGELGSNILDAKWIWEGSIRMAIGKGCLRTRSRY